MNWISKINNIGISKLLHRGFTNRNQIYSFSVQKYIPIMPLSPNATPLFVRSNYSAGGLRGGPSIWVCSIPAALFTINNYLTQWNMLTTSGFFLALLGGIVFRMTCISQMSFEVQALQVSEDLQKIYLTLPNTFETKRITNIERAFPKIPFAISSHDSQISNHLYIPLKERFEKSDQELKQKVIYQLNHSLVRIELNRSQIAKFQFRVDKQQLKKMEKEKDKLTQSELLQKYQSKDLLLATNIPVISGSNNYSKKGNIIFIINLSKNVQKKYHDYLVAWGLGYDIRPDIFQQKIKKEKTKF